MLPRPRPRPAPELVRERLRALAGGARHEVLVEPPDAPEHGVRRPALPAAVRPIAIAVGATALACWLLLRTVVGGPPTPVTLTPGSPIAVPSPTVASGLVATPSASAAADLVVHVLGDVRRPGLVTLPAGSRVADAIRAAGGLKPGGSAGGLNLARPLVDGEQVLVSRDAVAASTASGSGGGSGSAGPVDLNSATLEQLDALPGVGPVMAGRIIDWRTQHGRFASVDQLREVSGIGARTFERLAPLVRV